MTTQQPDHTYTALALFGGGGLFSYGAEQGRFGWRGVQGRVHVVASVDSWPKAAAVHDYLLPGSASVVMDLFTREDYTAFHGAPPPVDWREAQPSDLRALAPGGVDILMTSAPCKGFSSNLSEGKSRTAKYQSLNRLTIRGLWLALEAWRDAPPRLILFENVPRIRNRGASLLEEIYALLRSYGYTYDERDHDAGELGGLAQTRKRFLLAARLVTGAPFPVHLPVRQPLKGIGEVIGQLPIPLPGRRLPPMHSMPAGQHWITALRLALIPPGRDWRALKEVEAYAVGWHAGRGHWMVAVLREGEPWRAGPGWDDAQVVGTWEREEGGILASWMADRGWTQLGYRMREWGETSGTIGSHGGCATGSADAFIADPRISTEKHSDAFRPRQWDSPAGVVTGAFGAGAGAQAVADPRLSGTPWRGGYEIQPFDGEGRTVTAVHGSNTGAAHVADPRLPIAKFNNAFRVVRWDERGVAVTCGVGPTSGGQAVADPRLGCAPRAGAYGVMSYECTAPTVAASVDVHAGTAAVADPRLGGDREILRPMRSDVEPLGERGVLHLQAAQGEEQRRRKRSPKVDATGGRRARSAAACVPPLPGPQARGAWVILSPWGCWHRPCTTLEVALLQGLPARVHGVPLNFYGLGLSDSDAREVIGNGVPPPSAKAVAEEFGQALLEADGVVPVRMLLGGRWVQPEVS